MRIGSRATSSVERVSVKNALNPALWVCGLISAPATVGAIVVPNPSWLLIVLALGPVGVALLAFGFLLLVDRDRLQSESFQLRKQALELIEEKGTLGPVDPATIEIISNPDLPALPPPREGADE